MIIFWHDIERNLILLLLYNKESSIVSLFKHKKNECCLKWTNTCLKCIIFEILIIQCNFRQEKGTFRHIQTISQREYFLKCQKSVLKCKKLIQIDTRSTIQARKLTFQTNFDIFWLWSCKIKDWPFRNEESLLCGIIRMQLQMTLSQNIFLVKQKIESVFFIR